MAKSEQDERHDAIQRGQLARVAKAELGGLVAEREAALLSKCVALYRGGQLDGQTALNAFAAIAELRSLTNTIETNINNSIVASQEELGKARIQ